jgi:hypothetical protein
VNQSPRVAGRTGCRRIGKIANEYQFKTFKPFAADKRRFIPDSAVEREVMSKEQTFRSEDMPFGIANGKSQIPKYGICNLESEIPSASEDSLLQVCPSLIFNCGIRVQCSKFNVI